MAVTPANKIVRGNDLTAIGAAIKSALAEKVSSSIVKNIVSLTKAEYDALAAKDANTVYIITDSGGSYELKTNKVTALSASSTDTQYPSARCVYELIGDIETLLAAL